MFVYASNFYELKLNLTSRSNMAYLNSLMVQPKARSGDQANFAELNILI